MKKITITINTENAAFDPYPFDEIARIVRAWAGKVAHNAITIPLALYDVNGNEVGKVVIK